MNREKVVRGSPHRRPHRPYPVRAQFGQIMDLATKNNERFIVNRRGEPAVVIMSVQDFIRTAAPAPDWLEKAWPGAKQRGLDKLTSADIDSEITLYRRRDDTSSSGAS
jgi:prevent-host-death family protein